MRFPQGNFWPTGEVRSDPALDLDPQETLGVNGNAKASARDFVMAQTLRPYQTAMIDQCRESIRTGHKRPIIVCPTGGGKTLVASQIIRNATGKGKRVLFLAPRRELIQQAHGAFQRHGFNSGIIMAGVRPAPMWDVQIASFDSLHARAIRSERMQLPPAELVIVDEAHLSISQTRKDIIERYPNAIIVGLTATPARGDGRGLGEIYDDLVIGPTVAALTQEGFLVPARYFCPSKPDLAAVKLNKDGDYQENYLGEVMDKPQLVGDIIDNWTKIAPTRRTVVFCVNCAHSRHITDAFCQIGIRAEHLDGETPTEERRMILERVRSGATQVLCNVFVASYGLDIPELDCAVLARPTKNITLFLQTVGRVLRTAPSKVDAIIIDHAGAVDENGYADEVQPWSLDGKDTVKERKKKDKEAAKEPKQITCPECSFAFSGRRICPNCGHEAISPSKDIPVHEADLVEVQRDKKKANKEMTWEEKPYFLAQLNQYAIERGFKPGWAANQYRNKTGVWPNDPRLKNVGCVDVSLETRNWIKSQMIRHANRRTA